MVKLKKFNYIFKKYITGVYRSMQELNFYYHESHDLLWYIIKKYAQQQNLKFYAMLLNSVIGSYKTCLFQLIR